MVRGSHDGFVGDTGTNIYLLRRRMADSDLVIRSYKAGRRSHTELSLVYMKSLADPGLIEEIEKRTTIDV